MPPVTLPPGQVFDCEGYSIAIHSIRMTSDPAVTAIVTIYSQSDRSSRPSAEKNAFLYNLPPSSHSNFPI